MSKGITGTILAIIMITSIFSAIAPVPVAARTITVDGDSASYAGEWTPGDYPAGDRWETDPASDAGTGHNEDIHGYDLKALWGHYDEANDTMYFRLDVYGLPADLDGNGDTDTICSYPPGDCAGVSATEQYTLILGDNVEDTGLPGALLQYTDNAVACADCDAQYGADGVNDCIEFSLEHASTYIDPEDFCITVSAGGSADVPGEDGMTFCLYEKLPPEIHIDTEAIGCLEVEFTLWADNNPSILNYTLDFGDGDDEEGSGPFPVTTTHTYATPGTKHVTLTACNDDLCTTIHANVDVAGLPTAQMSFAPSCFEINGTPITFDGSGSYGDVAIVNWTWEITGGMTGTYYGETITIEVTAPITVELTVTDANGCQDSVSDEVEQCSGCTLRLYGTYGEGAGDFEALDKWTEMEPENKPYTDPLGPFHPQHVQAPRKDFITFNPAIMPHNALIGEDLEYPGLDYFQCGNFSDVQMPAEKVFKRMWYEKDWFKDSTQDGVWDVVTIDGEVMTLEEWLAIPAWERPTLREFNSPTMPGYDPDADLYGPAIIQEFTYMAIDQEDYYTPRFIGVGSDFLIPMASHQQNNGLDSFDANWNNELDYVSIRDEFRLYLEWVGDGMDPMYAMQAADIDGDWLFGPKAGLEFLDNDYDELSGDESVIFSLDNMELEEEQTIQFFDHVVTLKDVHELGDEGWAVFEVCDNEGPVGDSMQRCADSVSIQPNTVKYFYRGEERERSHPAERPTFYIRLISADAVDNTAEIEVGRVFGETYANINGLNPYWSQKAFMVDGVLYEVVAIKAQDSCFKYITIRQKLPKVDIKLYGKHLERWDIGEKLPELPPYNREHYILQDVRDSWEPIDGLEDKVGEPKMMPELVIDYVYEDLEWRYKGELKEILSEEWIDDVGEAEFEADQFFFGEEWWNLEWFWTLPWQYTEFRLPKDDLYLVTLSWTSPESEFVLWDSDPEEEEDPVARWKDDRVKFVYWDCSGPLYIDNKTRSIRLYGTFGEGAGDQDAYDWYDPYYVPENKPYTDPEGPFDPENEQAPVKDFMTFNPAIMDHNQGYPELDYYECPCDTWYSDVQIPKEKVFKRMWYEKVWFKDDPKNGEWDVVTDDGVMTLEEWLAIDLEDRPNIREWNSAGPTPPGTGWTQDPDADTYGPAIVQEFTYFATDDNIMPIMIGAGSNMLIPMASWDDGDGLDSFDADNDGDRDAVTICDEQYLFNRWWPSVAIPGEPFLADIDSDDWGLEWMGGFTPLMEDNMVILSLQNMYMEDEGVIRFFDHEVKLKSVSELGDSGTANFEVKNLEDDQSVTSDSPVITTIVPGGVAYFYRGQDLTNDRLRPTERPVFYLRVITADAVDDSAIVEVGRIFGETTATINGENPYWSQKAFMVDGVLYEVVAINAQDSCFKYITFRQKLPKMPIKLWGVELKTWDQDPVTNLSAVLPELPPFNEDHEILRDVQTSWTRPYDQYDKIGDKVPVGPLEIRYVEEDIEWRFKGALKEIYNETWFDEDFEFVEEEYWNVEWFWTQPWQYTAFVMPEDQLYLVTLSWIAPEAENTIWNHEPDGPVGFINGSRVKFWFDPGEDYLFDLYVNRLGYERPEQKIWDYFDELGNGGNNNGKIDLDELINAIDAFMWNQYPFDDDHALFDRGDFIDLLNQFIIEYCAEHPGACS